jgi:hypothetical protein
MVCNPATNTTRERRQSSPRFPEIFPEGEIFLLAACLAYDMVFHVLIFDVFLIEW